MAAGFALYSDDLASFEGLQRDYAHQTVNHRTTGLTKGQNLLGCIWEASGRLNSTSNSV